MRRHNAPVQSLVTAVVAILLVAACAPAASPSPVASASGAPASFAAAESNPPVASSAPTATPTLPPLPPSGSLPVRGSAWEIGVVASPASDGQLYVLVGRPDGAVLALLDQRGQPRPGWPVTIADAPGCRVVLPAADGSVRVLCQGYTPGGSPTPARAFAFDPNGRPRAGWPVDLSCCPDGLIVSRVIGDVLIVNERELDPGLVTSRVTTIAADGTIARGELATYAHCCQELMAIGPDGVVYHVTPDSDISGENSAEISAIGPGGLMPGFPIVVDGVVSPPSFDGAGRIHLTVGTPTDDGIETGPARTLVLDGTGQDVGGSGNLGFVATDSCSGIEGTCSRPAAPLVGGDGTTFVIGSGYLGTTAAAVSPAGDVMAGWPYRSNDGSQSRGVCPESDICEGSDLAIPALGPDNTLYLVHGAERPDAGSSIVAIGIDGRVREGWPVELTRAGSEFWSVVVGSDGTAYALAIEPEGDDVTSATILAIAPDSTVLYSTTVVEP
jgi:hypothetical protein